MIRNLYTQINNKSNYVIDIGASTGVNTDPVYSFITNSLFNGLCIEGDSTKAQRLRGNISPTFDIYNDYITPENVLEVFKKYNVPESPDVLKIDIDGYDLEVIRTILQIYKPKIIVAEINEKIPPPVLFEIKYSENYVWDYSHCFGFSITSGERVMSENNYKILEIFDLNNIICINQQLCDAIGVDYKSDVNKLYNDGYISKKQRFTTLPWNDNVNYWLNIEDCEELKREIVNYFENINDRSQFEIKTKKRNVDFILE